MDHITVPPGEVRHAPEVIEKALALMSVGRSAPPDVQRADAVRRKLGMMSFENLLILFFKWSQGDRTPTFLQLESELYPV